MQICDQPVPLPRLLRTTLGATVRSWAAALTLGLILFFFSETVFWGRPDRAPLSDLLITWCAYSVLAAALLYALTLFMVRSAPALVLCGALYGWLVEGVLAGTLYDAFPLQVSWTGLAWHDLLSVCSGWYGLSWALRRGTRHTALVAAGLGVFWGTWAVMWWQPAEGGVVTPLPAFAAHAMMQGSLVLLAFVLLPRLLRPTSFTSAWGRRLLGVLLAFWFAVVILPQRPLALLIAPPLFMLTVRALRRSRTRPDTGTNVVALMHQPVSWARAGLLLLMPGCAVVIYALFLWGGYLVPTNIVIFWVLTPLGFLAYLSSLWAVWRAER